MWHQTERFPGLTLLSLVFLRPTKGEARQVAPAPCPPTPNIPCWNIKCSKCPKHLSVPMRKGGSVEFIICWNWLACQTWQMIESLDYLHQLCIASMESRPTCCLDYCRLPSHSHRLTQRYLETQGSCLFNTNTRLNLHRLTSSNWLQVEST